MADAEAITEAAARPTVRFVALKQAFGLVFNGLVFNGLVFNGLVFKTRDLLVTKDTGAACSTWSL
jgi:hypothetical protein